MMNVGNPRARVRVRAAAERRRRPRAARIHHQQRRSACIRRRLPRVSTSSPAALKKQARRAQRAAIADPRDLLRREARRRRRDHRRGVLAQAGDRAAVGLQVERVPKLIGGERYEPRRGEPDARLPRRVALHRAATSTTASSSNARRCARCATSMGLTNVELMVPFVRTARRGASR